MMVKWLVGAALCALLPIPAQAQTYDERPAKLVPSTEGFNYERRVVEIPMRDGVRLHTVILLPKGAQDAGIVMTRTPYNADGMTGKGGNNADLASSITGYDNATDVIVDGGYIRVVQDVRGKYGSQGIYMMNPPLHDTALNPTHTDDSTDTYDTIDWLVKHLPESNRKVGIMGISYDGFLSLMPLIDPHPALVVAVPENPMVDGWRGDDWFHNGAFRLGIDYIWEQIATRDNASPFARTTYDEYDTAMRAGSAGALAKAHGLDQIGFWRKLSAHPAYDAFWQAQAMDRVLSRYPLKVPVMLVHGLWDQEDIYGATAVYRALKPKDTAGNMVYLTMGPWYHGQQIDDGKALGDIQWDQDTAKWWRRTVLGPFLAHYLKGTPMDVAPVTAFQSGTNQWQRLPGWPAQPAMTKLFLQPGDAVGFAPATGPVQTADYVSDPAHPVTNVPRPVRPVSYEDNHWKAWLVGDQRIVSSRPDVLTFTGPVLTQAVTIAGQPVVHLTAATTGTDSDWVVKLIDVYPDQVPSDPKMGGYQLAVGMDIFRGRYREGLDHAVALKPGVPLAYSWALPQANHVFLPGHRIMVQVQSSWFPLYDRNPQSFVPNIFFAKPADYVKATQQVTVSGPDQSYIALPVVH